VGEVAHFFYPFQKNRWYARDPGYVAIHPGDLLAGYRVTRLLARGGMGEVWAANGDGGGRQVAMKVLSARAAMNPDLERRFEREAKIASSVQSPYICQFLGMATSNDGALLLIFEHLAGESLSDRLKREQYLPFMEVGPLLDDVLNGLVAAHAASIIHRDLKPGNIFLERLEPPEAGERAKILDFGISKLTRQEHRKSEPTLTAFDATLGSFAYMAPEQVRGAARADERADIYALGAVAFRALSGRLPFEGTTAQALLSMKLQRAAPSLAEVTGEKWPAGIERFIQRTLERNREERFSSALEALEAWRTIHPVNVTPNRAALADRREIKESTTVAAGELDTAQTMTAETYVDPPRAKEAEALRRKAGRR
jgi:serine/threonine-protein kinase